MCSLLVAVLFLSPDADLPNNKDGPSASSNKENTSDGRGTGQKSYSTRSKNKHQENKNGHIKSVATHFTRARGNESGNSNVDDRGSNNQESVNIRRSGRKNAAQASSSGSGHGEEEDDARPEENNEPAQNRDNDAGDEYGNAGKTSMGKKRSSAGDDDDEDDDDATQIDEVDEEEPVTPLSKKPRR